MKERMIIIERIKDISIVVLFLTAILLLSFFGSNFSINDLRNINIDLIDDNDALYQPIAESLISPDNIKICFGSDIYTVVSPDYELSRELILDDGGFSDEESLPEENDESEAYEANEQSDADADNLTYAMGTTEYAEDSDAFESEIDDEDDNNNDDRERSNTLYGSLVTGMEIYLGSDDIRTEKIARAQYDEVMSYPSVSASFQYDIPFKEFLEKNSLSIPDDSEALSSLTTIGFSTASSENLFIYDASVDEYYRFVTEVKSIIEYMMNSIMNIINSIEQSGCMNYYSIKNLAGMENETLIPLYMESDIENVKGEEEFSIGDVSRVRHIEQMFFSSGLDFVRKITENKGSLLYMYGYSQKVLLINEDGSISYSEELDSTKYGETGFYDALSTAIEYIGTHGGWRDLYENGMVPYLKEVERVSKEDGKYNGYNFKFGFTLNGINIECSTDNMLCIEVYGSQVTKYNRDVIIVSGEYGEDPESDEEWIAKDAIDVITDEYQNICSVIADHFEELGDSEMQSVYESDGKFEEMMKRVGDIKLCFMRDKNKQTTEFIPVWYIAVDDCRFWFDPVTGIMLGSSTGNDVAVLPGR